MLPYQTITRKDEGIAIVGIGGAGANVLHCFASSSAQNVRLYSMSLDERLGRSGGKVRFIQLGTGLNHGLGSGGDPEVARCAAEDSREDIENMLSEVRLLVLVAGLGGGTGSGVAPVLAQMARERGIFLVSVMLMPFAFEGRRRREQSVRALEEISRVSDIVFCFENEYMEDLFNARSGVREVFEEVDRLLARATAAVPMMASSPGLINLGLDDLAAALRNSDSRCLFGSGNAYGPHRAAKAATAAMESPLISYQGAIKYAKTVVAHVAGGESLTLAEIRIAMDNVRKHLAGDDVSLLFGTSIKPHLGDEIRVTVIASIDEAEFRESLKNPPVPEEDTEEEEPPAEQPAPVFVPHEPAEPVQPAQSEEDEFETPEDEEEPEESAPAVPLRQGELMAGDDEPAADEDDEEEGFVVPDDDDDDLNMAPAPQSRYRVPLPRRASNREDLTNPPDLRLNDLTDIISRN